MNKTNTRVLRNSERYISKELILECFDFDNTNVIEKQICGNGFSSGFLSLPKEFKKTDILIAPNKSVVIDKERDYYNKKFPNKRIGFIYEGSRIDWTIKYDCIICVVDSFNFNAKELRKHFNVRYILVDEQHTVEQGASFRKTAMFNLKKNLELFNFSAISTVTATPNLFSDFNISIKNDIKPSKLFLSMNVSNTIDRLLDKVKRGETVLIFSQNASLIKTILKKANRNDFNFKGGDLMKANLCSKGKYIFNELSNLIICTSAAYEGWSCNVSNGNAFMFASYDSKINSMLGSNVYQSIGRLRKGSIHSELCLFDTTKTAKYIPNLPAVLEHYKNINSKVTTKQGKRYEFKFKGVKYTRHQLNPFILFKEDENGDLQMEILHDAVKVHLEQLQASKGFKEAYSTFFERRNVSLIDINEDINPKIKVVRSPEDEKINNLLFTLPNNLELVNIALYPFNDSLTLGKLKSALKINIAVREGLNIDCYHEKHAFNFITSKDFESTILQLCIDSGLKSGKHSKKETIKWFGDSNILETTYNIIYQILAGSHNYHKVGFREYSSFTSVPNTILKLIAEKLDLSFTELDIKSAYPRVLFALFGLEITEDFYGTSNRSKNKIKINTMLNNLHVKHNKTKSYIQRREKYNRKKLSEFFPSEIVDFLMDNFGKENYNSSKFFDFMTKHEETIINKCKKAIIYDNPNEDMFSLVRKHDAVLIFSKNYVSISNALKVDYLGFNNWFKSTNHYCKETDFYPNLIGVSA